VIKPVNVGMLEQYKPEFKKINPVAKVPGMREINPGLYDFNMNESHAIMKYICQRQNLPQHWYPFLAKSKPDLQLQASIDTYLDWHHGAIRMGAGGYMFRKYFSGIMDKNGVGASEFAINESY